MKQAKRQAAKPSLIWQLAVGMFRGFRLAVIVAGIACRTAALQIENFAAYLDTGNNNTAPGDEALGSREDRPIVFVFIEDTCASAPAQMSAHGVGRFWHLCLPMIWIPLRMAWPAQL